MAELRGVSHRDAAEYTAAMSRFTRGVAVVVTQIANDASCTKKQSQFVRPACYTSDELIVKSSGKEAGNSKVCDNVRFADQG